MRTAPATVNEKSAISKAAHQNTALRCPGHRDNNRIIFFGFVRGKSDKPARPAKSAGSPPKPEMKAKRVPRPIVAEKPSRNIVRPKFTAGRSQTHLAEAAPVFRRAGGGVVLIYGFHAVREAIRAGRRKLLELYATPEAAAKLADDIARVGLRPHLAEGRDITLRLGPGAVHQGALLEALPLPALDLSDIETKSGIVLVLDQITDPHNVGAILRSAAAFGANAVITTRRHAPEMAGVVAKAASGGLEHVDVITVANLAHALERLGDDGYLRAGLDPEAAHSLADVPLPDKVALVLGGEGKGLRRLTRERCDFLVRLETPGVIKSLNVSNACAVALALLRAGSG
jgi:23S rRNA (guanosine2251-2'-O)-methyltransferase